MDVVKQEIRNAASALKLRDANEAMTRAKLIDDVIFKLLGWHKDDVTVEDRVSEDGKNDFSDYIVTTGMHSILIEAKRIAFNFDGMPKSRRALLKGSWLTKPVGYPVRQARDYARSKGVGYCAATNGLAWIIFPVNRRDQVSFEESTALLFHDINSILEDDPDEFCGVFSRQAVIAGSLEKSLLGSDRDQNEPRRLNNIYDRSFSKINRSSIFSHIEREVMSAFSEGLLSDNIEILEKCYVTTAERTRFDTKIQMYLAPREQVLKTRPFRPIGKRVKGIEKILRESVVGARPIALLTLGLVGAGKTTFLDYTSKITGRGFFEEKSDSRPHWLYIDFRDSSKSKSPREHIIDGMFEYIKKDSYLRDRVQSIQPAYADEIQALIDGPLAFLSDQLAVEAKIGEFIFSEYQQKEPYALKVIKNAVAKSPVFLVIDNVDQIEEVDRQANIFLEATAIARQLECNLILAMRDATYVKNRSTAVFNAFEFDAVYIDPPNILTVLARRFDVAEGLLRGRKIEFFGDNGAKVIVEDGRIIFQLLRQSVLGSEVGRIIEVAATGDTRTALQMTRQFLQYGYTSTAKAVETYQRTGKYILPTHEALRAIILGNQNIYRDDFSEIGNPFDSYLGRSDLQLLRLYVMYVLVSFSSEKSFEGLPAVDIIATLEKIGVSENSTESVLKDLLKKRYVFAQSHREYNRETILIPSRLCGYVARDLVGKFIFVETMMFDTFIGENGVWDALKENMRLIYAERKDLVRKLGMRREAAFLFFEFCEDKLEIFVAEARNRGLPPQWCVNALTRLKPAFVDDQNRAISSARRNYGPANGQGATLPLFEPGSDAIS